MNEKYNKHDWKLFMQKLPQWQEQHMEKLCSEYVKILNRVGGYPLVEQPTFHTTVRTVRYTA